MFFYEGDYCMRNFDYQSIPEKLLISDIINQITYIHEHKGKEELRLTSNISELNSLIEVAKIQSTGSSNRIEGIYTSDQRLKELVQKKISPRNRSEEEIAGYQEVLSTIHENYEYISPTPNVILQLHRDLYSNSSGAVGGIYKNSDNAIVEIDSEGKQRTRFSPIPAFQTQEAMDSLCDNFLKSWNEDRIDKLILIPMFILDFLCIHPFNDGNGRMSRLLTLLLLYKAGYTVGKYISLEMIIEKSKETYYQALQDSSINWHENSNDYVPFIKYYLGVLIKAYREFEDRFMLMQSKISKTDQIKSIIDQHIGKITKKDLIEQCPDISKITIERTLTSMVKDGYLKKIGSARYTFYIKE